MWWVESIRPSPRKATCSRDIASLYPGYKLRLIAPGIEEVEPIIHPGLHQIDGAGIEFHSVVFELHRPIVPEGIFGADAEHPSADRTAARKREPIKAGDVHADVPAAVRPGSAELTVDKPPIEGVTGPPSQCRDPVEARLGMNHSEIKGLFDAGGGHLPFNPEHPLAELVIESSLATADSTAPIVAADNDDMATEIEPGPVVNNARRRAIDWPRSIGGLGRNRRRA